MSQESSVSFEWTDDPSFAMSGYGRELPITEDDKRRIEKQVRENLLTDIVQFLKLLTDYNEKDQKRYLIITIRFFYDEEGSMLDLRMQGWKSLVEITLHAGTINPGDEFKPIYSPQYVWCYVHVDPFPTTTKATREEVSKVMKYIKEKRKERFPDE